MTPKEIELVQRSLPAILALRDEAPTRLNELYATRGPAPRPLFAGADAGRQATLLITAVAHAVGAVRPGDRDRVEATLCQYHPRCGTETHHFRSAGAALVDALAQLESQFTAEQAEAWTAACNWVGRMVLAPRHSFAA